MYSFRQKALSILRLLLVKHENDPRYSSECMHL